MRALALVVLPLLCTLGCPNVGGSDGGAPGGEFSVLTYNVAALPQGLSSSDPERYIPLISPHLNAWDLVVVQEDFAFQRELREDVTLPYQSYPKETNGLLGDGLNRFSVFSFDLDVDRRRWEVCSGITGDSNDCLAEKGFSIARHTLGDDEDAPLLWVVNLHMDAGGGADNIAARAAQVEQLIRVLDEVTGDDALLVAGDTNTRPSREDITDDGVTDATVLERLTTGLGVVDACVPLSCGEEDRIDRVFLRSSAALTVEGTGYRLADELVDDDGAPLSDHEGVEVIVSWAG